MTGMTDLQQRGPVRFHRLTDEYGAFTNFSRHLVVIDGIVWPTSEHYFQAQKFPGSEHAVRIRECPTPSRAATLGRTPYLPLRANWVSVRVEVMKTAMRAKFVQHPRLAHQLVRTGDRLLIEATRSDYFWGAGEDGTGQNMIGRILTEIRSEMTSTTTTMQSPPGILSRRRWVLFGATAIVLPWQQQANGLNARALGILDRASTGADMRVSARATPNPQVLVEVAGEGGVLLCIPPGSDGVEDVAAAVARALAEPITWVHDPRWPRGYSS